MRSSPELAVSRLDSEDESAGGAGSARRMPVGAEVIAGGGVDFRVWAPAADRVDVVVEGGATLPLARDDDGYFQGVGRSLGAGALYRYRIDGGDLLPDPASRFQPDGPHGPSQVIDPDAFTWTDQAWRGISLKGQVIYEMHVGTFTPEGTWAGARTRLQALADVGVTVVEVMPVAAFPGRFGWGYDGVDLYAPYAAYGNPEDFRRFVDEAHRLRLGVILDVVYNHFGPDGNYLERFSSCYFAALETEWGKAINYDGDKCAPVRELVVENAAYWVREFHLDGLRLDATQSIFDSSPKHVVEELTARARAAAHPRSIVVVAENEPQHTKLVRPRTQGGMGLDGMWNDDLHHSATVALSGRREAYYTDYPGGAQEFLSAAKYGFLYQGQRYLWQKKRRGQSSRGVPACAFIGFLENHDQVANSVHGQRLWQAAAPGAYRAMTALLLLGPWTPMLFQGQEWASSRPFLYFADHKPDLAALVHKGRKEFLAQFPSAASAAAQAVLTAPEAEATFAKCRLDWNERESAFHAQMLALHRDLLGLRRSEAAIAAQPGGDPHELARGYRLDGSVINDRALLLRYLAPDEAEDRLLLVNLGATVHLSPAPDPLLGPPAGGRWGVLWSSDEPRYGGSSVGPVETEDDGWTIPGFAAVLLRPEREQERARSQRKEVAP